VGTKSLMSTCVRKPYSSLGRIMFQRVRTAAEVLPRNFLKIHSQHLPSFLYTSKRCSSRSDHRLCLLVLKRPCSPSLEHPSSSLPDPDRYRSNHYRHRYLTAHSLGIRVLGMELCPM
jgi:hypothetical protein